MSCSLFLQFIAMVVLICTLQFVMLLMWYPRIDIPVNDKVNKFTSSTLREVRKLIRHRADSEVDTLKLDNRVAVIVPYLGEKLPAWLDTFMLTASSSSDLFDWYIFIDDAPLIATPPNVKLVQITADDMYTRLARLDTKRYVHDAEFMRLAVQRLIENHPYVLVEFKPCLGSMFHDYIESYSHWAYADLDTLVGRIPEHLSQEHLNAFDFVSYSFGDNYRLYLRGQLTIVRNTPVVTNLWKDCEHLSSLGKRLDTFVQTTSATKVDSNDRSSGWRFQSAEGCFSKAAMDSRNVSIIYLSSQLSDAFSAPRIQKESLMLGRSIIRCHQEGINLSRDYSALSTLMTPSSQTSAAHSSAAASSSRWRRSAGQSELQLLRSSSANTPLRRLRNIRCSYWIEPTFDVCVEDLPSSANVVKRVDPSSGQITLSYHKVPEYELFSSSSGSVSDSVDRADSEAGATAGVSACREASIVHFQGWKHNYGSFVSRPPSGDAQALLITEAGLIPLRIAPPEAVEEKNSGDTAVNVSSSDVFALPTFSAVFDQSILYAGRLIPSDVTPARSAPAKPRPVKSLRSRETIEEDIDGDLRGPVTGSTDEVTAAAVVEEDGSPLISRLTSHSAELATRYCGGYSRDLKACACPIQSGDIELLQRTSTGGGHTGKKTKTGDVTMVLVGWDFDLYDRSLDLLLSSWDGPKVLVLGKTKEATSSMITSMGRRSDTTILLVSLGRCLSFINQDASPPHYLLPDNMLYNVALDVVSTDLVMLVPALSHTSRRVSLRSWKGGSSAGLAVQLKQKLHNLQAVLGAPERTAVFTYSNSPALVVPLYVVVDEEAALADAGESVEERSAAAVPSLHKYPLSNSWCGESQPASLQMSFEQVVGETGSEPLALPFDSKELLKERTLMLPVLFNMTAGPHGRDFVRFPEELSGHGCYGSASLRVLAGSGYTLYWATGGEYLSVGNKIREASPDGDFVLNEIACGCSFGNDATAMRDLTNRLNSYFLRAVELRAKGIGSVFTGEPFGKQFEKNTMKQT